MGREAGTREISAVRQDLPGPRNLQGYCTVKYESRWLLP